MNHDVHLWIARIFLVGLALFAVVYPALFLHQMIPFSFSGPSSWGLHWAVEDTAEVPLWARVVYFASWMPAIVATEVFIGAAIWLVILILRGVYFTRATVRALQWVGAAAAVSGVSILAAGSLALWQLTAFNSAERIPIRLWIESGEMGVLFDGLGVFLLAYLLKVTVLMADENREII